MPAQQHKCVILGFILLSLLLGIKSSSVKVDNTCNYRLCSWLNMNNSGNDEYKIIIRIIRDTYFGSVIKMTETHTHHRWLPPNPALPLSDQVIEFDDSSGSVLRIQPLRTHRDEAIYECTATNSVGQISTSAKLTVLEGNTWLPGFLPLCLTSRCAMCPCCLSCIRTVCHPLLTSLTHWQPKGFSWSCDILMFSHSSLSSCA